MKDKIKINVLVVMLVGCLMFISGFIGYTIANEETKEWENQATSYMQHYFYWKMQYQNLLWNDSLYEKGYAK